MKKAERERYREFLNLEALILVNANGWFMGFRPNLILKLDSRLSSAVKKKPMNVLREEKTPLHEKPE